RFSRDWSSDVCSSDLVADHGEEFWDHDFALHSFTLYEEVIHVPLFIKVPDIEPMEIPETVETIDILPTIADLLDLPANPEWQGEIGRASCRERKYIHD